MAEIKTKVPIDEPRSCKSCSKNGVCLIIRTLKGLAGQFEDPTAKSKAPFDVYDFAKICDEYQSVYVQALPKRTIDEVVNSQ
jgi:hypothetical protein